MAELEKAAAELKRLAMAPDVSSAIVISQAPQNIIPEVNESWEVDGNSSRDV